MTKPTFGTEYPASSIEYPAFVVKKSAIRSAFAAFATKSPPASCTDKYTQAEMDVAEILPVPPALSFVG
jgi:hypothetical protein